MGAGSKFKIEETEGIGLGVYISRFPHQLSVTIRVAKWYVYFGFGRGYDEL